MEKFTLTAFLTLSGLGAASGLVYHSNSIYIIADNSSFLYQYQTKDKKLISHKLVENAQNVIEKKEKLDLEAITKKGNELHVYGSGSKKNRCQNFIFNLENQNLQNINIALLYKKISKQTEITSEDLNIEGALYQGKNLLLFQRGNGKKAQNGIVKITPTERIAFVEINLPKIKNVAASFTDAVLIKDKIYFLAAAENSNSTYLDGEVVGSIFGVLNAKTFAVEKTVQITTNQKFEGLTFYKKNKNKLQFLLCEDNDTDALETTIYLLEI